MFDGYLHIAKRCDSCGLDYAVFDVGDGASVFVILIVGILVVGAALIMEIAYAPPYWVHAVLWIPAVLLLGLGGLRVVKSALMVLQFRHQAHEGRLVDH